MVFGKTISALKAILKQLTKTAQSSNMKANWMVRDTMDEEYASGMMQMENCSNHMMECGLMTLSMVKVLAYGMMKSAV